jgi:hypothetical protein
MNIFRYSIVSAVIGIILNIVLSFWLSPFATKNEIKPVNGAASLSFKSQIMHMLVHHKQVLLTSSLIVGLLVGISTFLALKL